MTVKVLSRNDIKVPDTFDEYPEVLFPEFAGTVNEYFDKFWFHNFSHRPTLTKNLVVFNHHGLMSSQVHAEGCAHSLRKGGESHSIDVVESTSQYWDDYYSVAPCAKAKSGEEFNLA